MENERKTRIIEAAIELGVSASYIIEFLNNRGYNVGLYTVINKELYGLLECEYKNDTILKKSAKEVKYDSYVHLENNNCEKFNEINKIKVDIEILNEFSVVISGIISYLKFEKINESKEEIINYKRIYYLSNKESFKILINYIYDFINGESLEEYSKVAGELNSSLNYFRQEFINEIYSLEYYDELQSEMNNINTNIVGDNLYSRLGQNFVSGNMPDQYPKWDIDYKSKIDEIDKQLWTAIKTIVFDVRVGDRYNKNERDIEKSKKSFLVLKQKLIIEGIESIINYTEGESLMFCRYSVSNNCELVELDVPYRRTSNAAPWNAERYIQVSYGKIQLLVKKEYFTKANNIIL
jgi:hypothetical protein